jgi:hypothetical protein
MSLQGGSDSCYICRNFSSVSLNSNIWTASQVAGPSLYISNISINADSTILYAVAGPDNSPSGQNSDIYSSVNGGSTWSRLPATFTANWAKLACDSTGTKVYGVVPGIGLYIFSPSTNTPVLIPDTSSFGALAIYANGSNMITGQSATIQTYSLHYANPIMCFHESTKILCYVDEADVYLPIWHMRKGTLVKTRLSGYVPVNMIGCSKIYNESHSLRGKNRLYRCSKENYGDLSEDLILTGCHSILVDSLTEEQRKLSIELTGDIYVTENKYRLIAMLDDRASPLQEEGVFPIWHFALDNTNDYHNYGVYANGGLLVETSSQRMMRDYSGMTLLS